MQAAYPVSWTHPAFGSGGYLSRAWKDVPIGGMDLQKGDGVLKLDAIERPGGSMPAIKVFVFERLLRSGRPVCATSSY